MAVKFGSLVGERLHDFVVDIVPVLPRELSDFDTDFIESALAFYDSRTASSFFFVFVGADDRTAARSNSRSTRFTTTCHDRLRFGDQ